MSRLSRAAPLATHPLASAGVDNPTQAWGLLRRPGLAQRLRDSLRPSEDGNELVRPWPLSVVSPVFAEVLQGLVGRRPCGAAAPATGNGHSIELRARMLVLIAMRQSRIWTAA
jgi:hypothetical protein